MIRNNFFEKIYFNYLIFAFILDSKKYYLIPKSGILYIKLIKIEYFLKIEFFSVNLYIDFLKINVIFYIKK